MTNGEIARRRGISLDAVKFHVANAIAKLGLENRRALRSWRGIPNDSALHRRMNRQETPMSKPKLALGPIGQISRTVKDIEQAEAWYGEVLGLAHLYTFGKLAFFDCGGTRLFLTEEGDGPSRESILYLRVEDIAAAHTELEARGVAFVAAPHMIHRHADGTEEWMAFFNDPDGRPLAIMSQVKV
jgi:catechol 2,3-dioxygenase-like lactoylglutathione lyase family enzyme